MINDLVIFTVDFTSIKEQQSIQLLEFTNLVICNSTNPLRFTSSDTDSYISLSNHIDIINSITYSQHRRLQTIFLNHLDNLFLLDRVDPEP